MSEQFSVGQWVWYWTDQRWTRVVNVDVDGGRVTLEGYEPYWTAARYITANPVIPPKPKRTVTKEAQLTDKHNLCPYPFNTGNYPQYCVPPGATNIRCLYDIEEDQ